MTICTSLPPRSQNVLDQTTNDRFLSMLNSIRSVARFAFRRHSRQQQQELSAEVVLAAFLMYRRLVEHGKENLAFGTVLAWYAIRQVRVGRSLGVRQNITDVLSPFAQRRKRFSVRSLADQDANGNWHELMIEGRHATAAEVAGFRIDFAEWLRRLKPMQRQLALRLICGDTPSEVAEHFRLTRPRISQLRNELCHNWHHFHGEIPQSAAAAVA
jgi:hypothetical protein